jgi:hypothetical protein
MGRSVPREAVGRSGGQTKNAKKKFTNIEVARRGWRVRCRSSPPTASVTAAAAADRDRDDRVLADCSPPARQSPVREKIRDDMRAVATTRALFFSLVVAVDHCHEP